jgi:hypothetical protein
VLIFLRSLNMVVHRWDSLTTVTFTFPFTVHNKMKCHYDFGRRKKISKHTATFTLLID